MSGSRIFKSRVLSLFLAILLISVCEAVTSRVTRHRSSQDFLKGESNDVVVGSRGTIQLSRRAETIIKELDDVWSINSIVVIGEKVYIGTSPNGGVYAYSDKGLTKIYSAGAFEKSGRRKSKKSEPEVSEPNDSNVITTESHLANEHIFAMATDISGRLLVGISGKRCALCRLEGGEMQTIFEPNDANYIFAIAVGKGGEIFIGTGPKGKIYRLDSLGKKPALVYDSPDKNILSLAQGPDGFIYAGSDTRGLIYKIDPRDGKAAVLYDSEQEEITSLLFFGEDLYAAATSANAIQAEMRFAAVPSQAGRPEHQDESEGLPDEEQDSKGGGTRLQIANIREEKPELQSEQKILPPRPPRPTRASLIYKITKDGFVDDVFNETAVFFCLAVQDKELLVGTGNNAQLFAVDPASEEQTILYNDRQASQITAVVVSGDDLYVGLANPARLLKLAKIFAKEGTYTSDLIDAGQPTKWGKLQIEAEVPQDCNIMMACRSGNVNDANDASFSEWTKLADVTGPVQLDCPAGRFCQYKVVLRTSESGQKSPVIREIAVADTVPNLAPSIESISVTRIETANKSGVLKISYESKDDNSDKLIYEIYFRKVGRTGWIEIGKGIESASFEWDGKTVEDGRYEIKVTAGDERSNTPETKLTGSRVSEAVVVDNTGPVIKSHTIKKAGRTFTLKMNVSDELSAIGKVEYTIDSDANWKGVLPDDLVYDTTGEDFSVVADKLTAGQHVIALRLADAVGNTTYKTFEVNIEEK